jgi:hypothetical protein
VILLGVTVERRQILDVAAGLERIVSLDVVQTEAKGAIVDNELSGVGIIELQAV